MSAFENNLKRLRSQRNLKQEDLAARMNVSRQTVSGWETGRRQPDLETLKRLAEVLDADIHELIYGNKPGEYPKFQKKYVIRTVILGGFVTILVLFRLLLWPHLKKLYFTAHWGLALTICYCFLPQIGSFAFGALIPSMIQLFMPVRISKPWARCALAGGILAALPVILFWFGVKPCSRWILYPIGSALLSYILPFASGLGIAVSVPRESDR